MFVVTVLFEIGEGLMPRFMPLMLQNAKASVQSEAGCLQFDVCSDEARSNEVFLYEVYTDRSAFDLHLKTAHFEAFNTSTANMITAKKVQTFSRVDR
jgi:quinol monooxygenase YgiN